MIPHNDLNPVVPEGKRAGRWFLANARGRGIQLVDTMVADLVKGIGLSVQKIPEKSVEYALEDCHSCMSDTAVFYHRVYNSIPNVKLVGLWDGEKQRWVGRCLINLETKKIAPCYGEKWFILAARLWFAGFTPGEITTAEELKKAQSTVHASMYYGDVQPFVDPFMKSPGWDGREVQHPTEYVQPLNIRKNGKAYNYYIPDPNYPDRSYWVDDEWGQTKENVRGTYISKTKYEKMILRYEQQRKRLGIHPEATGFCILGTKRHAGWIRIEGSISVSYQQGIFLDSIREHIDYPAEHISTDIGKYVKRVDNRDGYPWEKYDVWFGGADRGVSKARHIVREHVVYTASEKLAIEAMEATMGEGR